MPSTFENLAATIIASARSRADLGVMYATPKLTPTPSAVLDRIEQEIDAKLPPEIRSFYAGTEQLGLVWQAGTAKETSAQPEGWNELCNLDGDYWGASLTPTRDLSKPGGIIVIPTAAEVFRKGYWLDRIIPEPDGYDMNIDGVAYSDKEVCVDLYPFDFVTTFYIAAFWYNRKRNEWRVLMGDDHGACWTTYKSLSVAEYFAELERGLGGARSFSTNSSNDSEQREIWGLRKEN